MQNIQARSSGGERYPDTVEVGGSNPLVPTMISRGYGYLHNPFVVFATILLPLVLKITLHL